MALIEAIVPILLLIALLTPVITGYLRKRKRVSILLGWGLLVFAYLSSDILVPMVAYKLYGPKEASRLSQETPGTIAMVFVGWIYPYLCHYIGVILRKGIDFSRGRWARKLP